MSSPPQRFPCLVPGCGKTYSRKDAVAKHAKQAHATSTQNSQPNQFSPQAPVATTNSSLAPIFGASTTPSRIASQIASSPTTTPFSQQQTSAVTRPTTNILKMEETSTPGGIANNIAGLRLRILPITPQLFASSPAAGDGGAGRRVIPARTIKIENDNSLITAESPAPQVAPPSAPQVEVAPPSTPSHPVSSFSAIRVELPPPTVSPISPATSPRRQTITNGAATTPTPTIKIATENVASASTTPAAASLRPKVLGARRFANMALAADEDIMPVHMIRGGAERRKIYVESDVDDDSESDGFESPSTSSSRSASPDLPTTPSKAKGKQPIHRSPTTNRSTLRTKTPSFVPQRRPAISAASRSTVHLPSAVSRPIRQATRTETPTPTTGPRTTRHFSAVQSTSATEPEVVELDPQPAARTLIYTRNPSHSPAADIQNPTARTSGVAYLSSLLSGPFATHIPNMSFSDTSLPLTFNANYRPVPAKEKDKEINEEGGWPGADWDFFAGGNISVGIKRKRVVGREGEGGDGKEGEGEGDGRGKEMGQRKKRKYVWKNPLRNQGFRHRGSAGGAGSTAIVGDDAGNDGGEVED